MGPRELKQTRLVSGEEEEATGSFSWRVRRHVDFGITVVVWLALLRARVTEPTRPA
jgi:hypothetical protein